MPFYYMDNEKDVDDKFLRTLDESFKDGKFALIVTTNSFGMRGFDYRGHKVGLVLIIAASFENDR